MNIKGVLLAIGITALFWDDIANVFTKSRKPANTEKKLTPKNESRENNTIQKPAADPPQAEKKPAADPLQAEKKPAADPLQADESKTE